MRKTLLCLLFMMLGFCHVAVYSAYAQSTNRSFTPTLTPTPLLSPSPAPTDTPTDTPTPTISATQQALTIVDLNKQRLEKENKNIESLFAKRPAKQPTYTNFIAYAVQYAVRIGIPADTVIFILLLPFLATIVAFSRQIIGLPNLGILVAISFSIIFLTIGITASVILLAAIILASTIGRIILKRVRIMQLPKMALSVFVVAIFMFIALMVSGSFGILMVSDLSIFPILLLILLGERIVALQLERPPHEALIITFITLILGLLGFLILSYIPLRRIVLLYPETIFLLIPINILIGRYFGLRLTEYFRFREMLRHGSK